MTVDEYIREHAILSGQGVRALVPDTGLVPARIERALTRRYGRPETGDRGEVAYWTLSAKDQARLGLVDEEVSQ